MDIRKYRIALLTLSVETIHRKLYGRHHSGQTIKAHNHAKRESPSYRSIDCFDYDTTNRKAAIGLLIDPGHKRQGFGRDALETFVEYAFRFLHLHQLYVHIPVCNTASIALFRTCGFHESTRLKDWIRLPQGYADALIFQKFNRE